MNQKKLRAFELDQATYRLTTTTGSLVNLTVDYQQGTFKIIQDGVELALDSVSEAARIAQDLISRKAGKNVIQNVYDRMGSK